ncbi:hypothetical protein [Nonomuraea sp. CA-141351]|uniref:hypothetical protein n=1 Tax=Nonomuraea sp. CA-141351 TaxID=3239996 RepID=UPI003D8D3192
MGGGRYEIINRGTGIALDGAGNATVGSDVVWMPNGSTSNHGTITIAWRHEDHRAGPHPRGGGRPGGVGASGGQRWSVSTPGRQGKEL